MKIINGAPSIGVSLSEKEIIKFLKSNKMNLQLGTLDEKNEVNIHPVWFIFENDRFFIATETNSKKISNIKNNSRVYFLVANEESPYLGVKGKGNTRILYDMETNIKITEKIILKYLERKDSRLAKEVLEEISKGEEVVIEIIPEYYSAWKFYSD